MMIDLLVISSDWALFKLDLPIFRAVNFWSLLLLLLLLVGVCSKNNKLKFAIEQTAFFFPYFCITFSFLIANTFSIQLMTTNRIGKINFFSFPSAFGADVSPLHTEKKMF